MREQIRKGVGGGAPAQPLAAEEEYPYQPALSVAAPITGTRAASESFTAAGEAALMTLQQSLQRLEVQ